MINRDRLIGMCATHPSAMRSAMYAVISKGQDRPEVQIQATAMALVGMCESVGIDVKEVLNTVEQLKADLDGPFVDVFRAVEAYSTNEIGSKFQ